MPDLRLARARRSLPENYQFGDAAPTMFDHVDAWMDAIGAQSIAREYVLVMQPDGTIQRIPLQQKFACR